MQSNDPLEPNLTLTIAAEVFTPIATFPGRSFVLQGLLGGPLRSELLVRRSDGEALALSLARVSREGLQVSLRELDAPALDERSLPRGAKAGDWLVTLEPAPGLDEALAAAGEVVLATDHPEVPELSLPFRAQVRPVLAASPARSTHVHVAGSASSASRVTLRHGNARPFTLLATSLVDAPPGLEARASKGARGVHVVTLTMKGAEARPGRYEARLLVETDVPRAPQISVPLSVVVRPAVSGEAAAGARR